MCVCVNVPLSLRNRCLFIQLISSKTFLSQKTLKMQTGGLSKWLILEMSLNVALAQENSATDELGIRDQSKQDS